MSQIKRGDRVKATNKLNDDTAEFTVTSANDSYVESEHNTYTRSVFDFEIVRKPLPTQPGIYHANIYGDREDTELTSLRRLLLTTKGQWYWMDFTASKGSDILEPAEESSVAEYVQTLVYGGAQ